MGDQAGTQEEPDPTVSAPLSTKHRREQVERLAPITDEFLTW
jgi:hypothetical protein